MDISSQKIKIQGISKISDFFIAKKWQKRNFCDFW